jgi:Predicted ATP-dependent Lon-type protease
MTSETTIPSGLDELLIRTFAGKVVRKDLTKLVKEGAKVPAFVLEYLLGGNCPPGDEAGIAEGLEKSNEFWPTTTSGPTSGRRSSRSSASGAATRSSTRSPSP